MGNGSEVGGVGVKRSVDRGSMGMFAPGNSKEDEAGFMCQGAWFECQMAAQAFVGISEAPADIGRSLRAERGPAGPRLHPCNQRPIGMGHHRLEFPPPAPVPTQSLGQP